MGPRNGDRGPSPLASLLIAAVRSQSHPDTVGLLTDEGEEEFTEEEEEEEESVSTEGKEGRSPALVLSLIGMPGYTLPGCVLGVNLRSLLLLHMGVGGMHTYTRVCTLLCSGVPMQRPKTYIQDLLDHSPLHSLRQSLLIELRVHGFASLASQAAQGFIFLSSAFWHHKGYHGHLAFL